MTTDSTIQVSISIPSNVLDFIIKGLQDLNVDMTMISQAILKKEKYDLDTINRAVDLTARLASLQAAINSFYPNSPKSETISEPVEQVPQLISRETVTPTMFNLETLLEKFFSNKFIQNGVGSLDFENSTLNKFKETVGVWKPWQIINWSDGWYGLFGGSFKELLLTMDNQNKTRVFIHSNEDSIMIFQSTGDHEDSEWIDSKYLPQSITDTLKALLLFKLSGLVFATDLKRQEESARRV